jgi:hypothetical protein
LVYFGLEYGFVNTHAWVDIWKTFHIFIQILQASMLIKKKIYVLAWQV